MRRQSPPSPRIIALLVLACFLLPRPGAAAGPATACAALGPADEEQQLRLSHFGSEAGTERYRISRSAGGDSLIVTSESAGSLPGRPFTTRMRLAVDPVDFSLLRYRLDAIAAGETQVIQAWRTADSVIVDIQTPRGGLRRGFAEPGRVYIADNLIASHLVLLACRAPSPPGLSETVRVVIPQVGAVLPAVLTSAAPAPDGSRAIDFTIAAVRQTISLDPAGAVQAIDIPSQSLRYFSPRLSDARQKMPIADGPRRPPVEMVPEAQALPTRVLFEEEVVRFVSGAVELSGIVTLPRGGQPIPYPTVVFLPGSGHQDRDNAIGPNRPFFDIARGLAVQGIASFRFDKRSVADPKSIDMPRATVEQDLIIDALAAIEFIRSRGDVDGNRMVLLGYELGGALAAEIANDSGRVAGIVVFSSSPRPLDERMRDEVLLMKSEGRADAAGMSDRFLRQLDSLIAGTLPAERQLMGIRAGYLADLRTRDLAGEFERFGGPILVVRGGKNHLEFASDAKLWSDLAARRGKRTTEIRDYPALGPLLIPIRGETGPAAFFEAGTVDPSVIDGIASFILRIR